MNEISRRDMLALLGAAALTPLSRTHGADRHATRQGPGFGSARSPQG